MCPKFLYQHENRPCILAPKSGEIYYCATWVKPFWPNVHPDELICQFVRNLKMSVTKVTGVSLETLKDCMLQNLKMIPLTIRSWKPELSHKWQDDFPSLFIFKACISYYFFLVILFVIKLYSRINISFLRFTKKKAL